MKKVTALIAFLGVVSFYFLLQPESPRVVAHQNQEKPADEKQDEAEESVTRLLKDFMQKKLASSNLILKGLVTDELTLVSKGADELLSMSRQEKWRASTDMMYLQHSQEFRRSVESLKAKAEKQSIDGAALAWMDVTMNCIQCHQWVRDVMIADIGSPFDTNAAVAETTVATSDATEKPKALKESR